ncbi:proton/glutamate symporter [Sphingomonas sp. DBB INV C78]|uniref:dicarboxylate/amino acid:cation symporter n=1 Tax=Sphingomonas sp. DBB INV C78 TaxID=3349434 RepID=UPI0036D3367D
MTQGWRILLGLAAGLAVGIGLAATHAPFGEDVASVAATVGGLWLDALKMTIVPLVFALVVSGVVSTASAATAGGIAARSIGLFLVLLTAGTAISAIATPALLAAIPAPAGSAEALRHAITGAAAEALPPAPSAGAMLRSIIPTNPIAAAAESAMLPLVVFALFFGFAASRLPDARRSHIDGLFMAIAEIMLIMVGWVLWAAPAGAFALALAVAARTGMAAVGAFAHYILIISAICVLIGLCAYPLAAIGARVPIGRFARAAAPVQGIAVSTQSSLASLPATIAAARNQLGLPDRITGVTLPLAASLYRSTSPAANLAVAIYIASIMGIALTPATIAAGGAVAIAVSLGGVSVASQVTFVALIAPICIAMGVPIELLALLIAVETIPDIFRTASNVTMNLAAATLVDRMTPGDRPQT